MSFAPASPAPAPIATQASSAAPVFAQRGQVTVAVQHLRKVYGSTEAVHDLSFEIYTGEVFGLLGPNGAGKTTAISMIATQLRPTAGDALVFGLSVQRDTHQVRQLIGFVPQEVSLYPQLSARENLKFFGRMYGVKGAALERRVEELLELVGLENRTREPVAQYSGGMKRRLNLAVSLVHQPRLLLLDEPTVGVDPHSREKIFSIVRQLRDEGRAILYTTHYMEEAERLCDRLGIMDEGKIIALGSLTELLHEAGCSEVVEIRGLPSVVDVNALHSVPGVCRVEAHPGGVRLFVNRAVRVLAPLSQFLSRYGDGVTVEIAPLSLENLFLQLTGKELRD